ncbi:MFS amino acid permease [Mycena rebaudengoi]|nr:MFS amino acid permease [Mycena rebaudengoi]
MASVTSHPVAENDTQKRGSDTKPAKEDDEHVVPHNNLPLVFFAMMLTNFLAALDQTIVATALPTIVAQLGGGNNYSWVASAYLIANASLCPVYGKLSDVIGRKLVLYPSIVIFLIGSALCGAAKSMTWLIIARALQGIGGGGISQLIQIVTADIVPLEERGTYGAFVGAMWGIAGVVGPLVGGVLTGHVSWRWCFFINLPTGGVAGILLFFSLNLNPHHGKSLVEHLREFDFVGLILIVGGVVCLLLGFNRSQDGWNAPATIALLVAGCTTLVLGGLHEFWTKRSPIIPPRLFKTRTTGLIFITAFLHAFAFFSAAFYLPLYFQILGASATKSGILQVVLSVMLAYCVLIDDRIIPFSLVSSFTSAVAGVAVSKLGDYRPVMRVSYAIMAIGYGLMIMLDDRSSLAVQLIYPIIAGFGLGGLFVPQLIALQAAMPVKDVATSSTALGLFWSLGATIGASVGQTIWTGELSRRLRKLPDLNIDIMSGSLADSVRKLQLIEPAELRRQVIRAYATSVSTIWLVNTPIVCACFVGVLFLKKYTLTRRVIRTAKPNGKPAVGDLLSADPSVGGDHEQALSDKGLTEESRASIRQTLE